MLPRALAITGVVLLVALLAWGLASTGPDKRIDEGLAQGEAPPAPGFDLSLLERGTSPPALGPGVDSAFDDDEVSLSELRGTPVLLNFWASWCVPCREEAPILERGWGLYGPKGVLFVGLDMQDLTGDARAFLEEFAITYPSIRDPGDDTAQAYGAIGIPETYFISAEGRVVSHVVGVISNQQLAAGVRAARRGRVIGELTGGARRPQR